MSLLVGLNASAEEIRTYSSGSSRLIVRDQITQCYAMADSEFIDSSEDCIQFRKDLESLLTDLYK